MSFNLTSEKWIPVVSMDWQRQEVSLIELFKTWEQWREIQADNPPTTLALYRLLLAILHRAYQGPTDADHWLEIGDDNGKNAIAYLQEYADCFDLIHPEKPFMQDLTLSNNDPSPIYNFSILQTSATVFSHVNSWTGHSAQLAEAARILVRMQSVDITSLRGFYPPQTKGNRSAANTPTINAANVFVHGQNLKQSLILNLIRYDPEADEPSAIRGEDLPTWETGGYVGIPKKLIPNGYINYLTYPWRRLLLFTSGDDVVQIAITMGDSLPESISAAQWECHIPYKQVEKESKPVRLSLERQLWRDADCFLQSTDTSYPPRIVNWLSNIYEGDRIYFQVFGLSADKAKPLGWTIEQLAVPSLYLSDRKLWEALKIAIEFAEKHQQIFRSFRSSPYYSLAEGLNPDSTGGDAISSQAGQLAKSLDGESRYWLTLDSLFPLLLDDLTTDENVGIDGIKRYGQTKIPEWEKKVQDAARHAFEGSIEAIRDYRARALALRSLSFYLLKLREEKSESQATKKSKTTKTTKKK
jgi:CRISPR system Cascade subunit CasA